MATAESSLEIDAWVPEDQGKQLENEAEKNNSRSDTENNQQRYDSVEKEPVTESEKGNYIFGTDDSEAEGDGLESELDYDKNLDDDVIGSGDGQTDTDCTVRSVSPKCEVDIRHRSGHDATCGNASLGLIRKESPKHDLEQTGQPCVHDDGADSQKEVTSRINTQRRRTTSSARNAASHTSFREWFVFLAPRAACIIMLSMIYLCLAILSIRMLRLLTEQY